MPSSSSWSRGPISNEKPAWLSQFRDHERVAILTTISDALRRFGCLSNEVDAMLQRTYGLAEKQIDDLAKWVYSQYDRANGFQNDPLPQPAGTTDGGLDSFMPSPRIGSNTFHNLETMPPVNLEHSQMHLPSDRLSMSHYDYPPMSHGSGNSTSSQFSGEHPRNNMIPHSLSRGNLLHSSSGSPHGGSIHGANFSTGQSTARPMNSNHGLPASRDDEGYGNKRNELRKGKWTIEEEDYTRRLVQHFNAGLLFIPEGTTLRAFLSSRLKCDRMRITKKFRGVCFGRKYRSCECTAHNHAIMKAAENELNQLESRFIVRNEQLEDKKAALAEDVESCVCGSMRSQPGSMQKTMGSSHSTHDNMALSHGDISPSHQSRSLSGMRRIQGSSHSGDSLHPPVGQDPQNYFGSSHLSPPNQNAEASRHSRASNFYSSSQSYSKGGSSNSDPASDGHNGTETSAHPPFSKSEVEGGNGDLEEPAVPAHHENPVEPTENPDGDRTPDLDERPPPQDGDVLTDEAKVNQPLGDDRPMDSEDQELGKDPADEGKTVKKDNQLDDDSEAPKVGPTMWRSNKEIDLPVSEALTTQAPRNQNQQQQAQARRVAELLENPSDALLLVLGQKYLAQLKKQAHNLHRMRNEAQMGETPGGMPRSQDILSSSPMLGSRPMDVWKSRNDDEGSLEPTNGEAGPAKRRRVDQVRSWNVERSSAMGSLLPGRNVNIMACEEDTSAGNLLLSFFNSAGHSTVLSSGMFNGIDGHTGPDGELKPGEGACVLVADDSDSTLKFLKTRFENNGYVVETVCNGQDALKSMKKKNYDLVFLDLEMPIMNGFSCSAEFREWERANNRTKRQPICALSMHTGKEEKEMCAEVGVDFFEAKPAKIPGLMKIAELCIKLQNRT
mmetsp:Transcript_4292/g.5070  ORF Transcript_4292/g.5070 Transcript_4292/m.5070 type:complete len:893 (-) Transcript_4292:299-2977(-)